MKHLCRVLTIGLFLITLPSFGSVAPWEPNLSFDGSTVSGVAATTHSPEQIKMEIWESEKCTARVSSRQKINLSGNCEYLRGAFRYIHRANGIKMQLLQTFALHSEEKQRIFIAERPIEIYEVATK